MRVCAYVYVYAYANVCMYLCEYNNPFRRAEGNKIIF